jgi:hypothetical protein
MKALGEKTNVLQIIEFNGPFRPRAVDTGTSLPYTSTPGGSGARSAQATRAV